MKYSIVNKEDKIYICFSRPINNKLDLIQSLESIDGVKWTISRAADEKMLVMLREPYVTMDDIRVRIKYWLKSNNYEAEYVEAYS